MTSDDGEPRTLAIFPLNTVVFPGAQVPLHVFEDRHVALVHELLAEPSPQERLFATTAIREGYEVGTHGATSLYRTGCVLQLTEYEQHPDGTFDIVTVARDRFHLDGIEVGPLISRARIHILPDPVEDVSPVTMELARAAFTGYRAAIAQYTGDPYSGTLPRDPVYLSWTLSALAPLPLTHRQRLLEADSAAERLELVTALLRDELRAINVIPSLPASHVPTAAWSPN